MMPRAERAERVADMLRTARAKLGITVEKAAADASIPIQYVRLLEGETAVHVGVADEFYLIPYFRRYASFLGFDANELVSEFLSQLRPAGPSAPSAPVTFAYRSRLIGLWKPLAIVAVVLVAASLIAQQSPEQVPLDDDYPPVVERRADGGAGAQTAERRDTAPAAERVASADTKPEDHAGDAAPAHAPAQPAADAAPAAAPPNAGAVAPPGGSAPAAQPGAPAPAVAVANPADMGAPAGGTPGQRELKITAAEETWLAIAVDDQPVRSTLLKPGDSRTWTAQAGFTLTVGNAGGITVALDGQELPRLGGSGQVVRNLRLPRTDAPPERLNDSG